MVAENLVFVGILVMALGIGSLSHYCCRQAWKRLYLFRCCPPQSVLQLKPGTHAAVSGQAFISPSLQSPITQTPCVLWHCQILENQSSNKHRRVITLYDQTSTKAFTLHDSSGYVEVLPSHIKLHRTHFKASTRTTQDPQVLKMLSKLGIQLQQKWGPFQRTRSITVKKYLVKTGQTLYVWGVQPRTKQFLPLLVSDIPKSRLMLWVYGYFLGAIALLLLSLEIGRQMLNN